ncbi:PilZ domain-containing protein [Pseudomonas sp.]|jgi:hypothetical protein|uniref:PilZ domain-containing protein n=1 Tax=Pseudomonas sp. TaxID=306 RepID=UPI0028AC6EDD|nr:PilZ domain-containing protein [Pseudomonas sp.]
MPNQRRHPRTPFKCRIKVSHPSFGDLIALTRDLSDGGVFIVHPRLVELSRGAVVRGQVQDLPIDAPVLLMRVVRHEEEGIGVMFLLDDQP